MASPQFVSLPAGGQVWIRSLGGTQQSSPLNSVGRIGEALSELASEAEARAHAELQAQSQKVRRQMDEIVASSDNLLQHHTSQNAHARDRIDRFRGTLDSQDRSVTEDLTHTKMFHDREHIRKSDAAACRNVKIWDRLHASSLQIKADNARLRTELEAEERTNAENERRAMMQQILEDKLAAEQQERENKAEDWTRRDVQLALANLEEAQRAAHMEKEFEVEHEQESSDESDNETAARSMEAVQKAVMAAQTRISLPNRNDGKCPPKSLTTRLRNSPCAVNQIQRMAIQVQGVPVLRSSSRSSKINST